MKLFKLIMISLHLTYF